MNTLQTESPSRLHHLHITSGDPARLADFYRNQLSLEESRIGDVHVLRGGARSILISRGASAELLYAGYAVKNEQSLLALQHRLAGQGMEMMPIQDPFYHAGAFSIADPQGRRIAFGAALSQDVTDSEPARLQHTVFQSTELDSVVRFYVEKVGFTISDEVVNDIGESMVVFMRSDDEHHSLAFFRGSKNEWDHHCYETNEWNNIRDWGDKFAKLRIPIFFGPGRHGPGNNLFFMVTDPDGNRLEFSAELEHVSAETLPGIWPHDEYTLNSWGRAWIRS